MEILSNFSSAYCFVSFILGAMFMFVAICIAAMGKVQEPMNKVHFYVARDKPGTLCLYMCKPIRHKTFFFYCQRKGVCMGCDSQFKWYGLNENDYKDLKWEDEPIEVFLNLED